MKILKTKDRIRERVLLLEKLVDNPSDILSKFSISTLNQNGQICCRCPNCAELVEILRAQTGYEWACRCNLHLIFRSNLISLIRCYQLANNSSIRFSQLLADFENAVLSGRQLNLTLSQSTANYKLAFGKYKNMTIHHILCDKDFNYLHWLLTCELLPANISSELAYIFS